MSQNKISVIPKVKDVAEFNFHEPRGEGHLGILFSRSRTKTGLKNPDLILWISHQPISGPS